MKNDSTPAESAEKTRRRAPEEPYIKVPCWLARKAKDEKVSFDQLFTYCWIFTKNYFARRTTGGIYGKRTYRALCKEIEDNLGIYDAGDLCRALEEAGWLQKAPAKAYGTTRQVGYLCLLSADDRQQARAVQQQLSIPDEENVIEMESALPNNGEYIRFGCRYYDDADGNPCPVPGAAPQRPTLTAVWCNDPEGWYEPDDLPEHENEY